MKEFQKISTTDFDKFWLEYPRKAGSKKKAKAKWERLSIKKQETILDDIKIRFQGVEKKFIPYPTTYLNGAYWECEIEVNKSLPQTNEEWLNLGETMNPPLLPRRGEPWPEYKKRIMEGL